MAAIFAIAGIVMMTYADGFHSHSVIGIALVVGSASMSALYKVSTTRSPHRKVSGPLCCIRAPFTVPLPQAETGRGKLLELGCLPAREVQDLQQPVWLCLVGFIQTSAGQCKIWRSCLIPVRVGRLQCPLRYLYSCHPLFYQSGILELF